VLYCTTATGTAAKGNGDGISILGAREDNISATDGDGPDDEAEGNVFGNRMYGITIAEVGSIQTSRRDLMAECQRPGAIPMAHLIPPFRSQAAATGSAPTRTASRTGPNETSFTQLTNGIRDPSTSWNIVAGTTSHRCDRDR